MNHDRIMNLIDFDRASAASMHFCQPDDLRDSVRDILDQLQSTQTVHFIPDGVLTTGATWIVIPNGTPDVFISFGPGPIGEHAAATAADLLETGQHSVIQYRLQDVTHLMRAAIKAADQ